METDEELLKPIAEDMPCGLNLEYDLEFLALGKDVQGEPERYIGNVPAKDPNWNNIHSRARSLLLRSKDLNVLIWYTRACAHCNGISGLLSGLRLIQNCLMRYWDCVHPCLDPEDNNDPEARLNILSQLGSYEIFVRDVYGINLTFKHAKLTIRDVLIIQGKLSVSNDQSEYTQAQVEEIFRSPENVPVIQNFQKQLESALEILKDLRKILIQKLGDISSLPSFEKLEATLFSLKRLCADSASNDDGEITALAGSDDSAATISSAAGGAAGEIRSREDIVRVLEKVCRYIERTEPTNPAALVIRFAQNLMTKNFVEIMEMLPPEDLKIFKKILDLKSKK